MTPPLPSPTSAFGDALVILGAAGVVIPVFARFRITPVIGFILVGLLVGPHGLGGMVGRWPWLASVTITDAARLTPFAEFGIVLLLFSVGLELSFDRLWTMRRLVFGLGALELLGSAALIAPALILAGQHWRGAAGTAMALAMSSTALVLPIVRARAGGAVAQATLATLLFEDIALVPVIFLIGAVAPAHGGGWWVMGRTLALGLAAVAVLLIGGRFVLPRLFAQAARTKSPELFLSASLLVVIIASLATSAAGLSAIVGALIAGLVIAETEYHGEVEAMLMPFRGLALGIFLITIGMGLDVPLLLRHPWVVLGAVLGVLTAKALVTSLAMWLTGARRASAAEAGILLAAPSETTLIVLASAAGAGLIGARAEHFWALVTALGMTVTPGLASAGRRLARRLEAAFPPVAPDAAPPGEARAIIIGFGRVGRMVGDMLRAHGKPFIGLDADADLIRAARADGYVATFGDAGRGHLLERLGVGEASAVILTMDAPAAAARIVRRLRGAHPDLPIIARARDAAHAAQLYRAGATHAVPETLEASLQLAEAVLVDMGVPMGFVIASIHEKRDELRDEIMHLGELETKPKLKSAALRDGQG